jgi:transportin-1
LRSSSSLIRSSTLHALSKFSDWIVKQDGLE